MIRKLVPQLKKKDLSIKKEEDPIEQILQGLADIESLISDNLECDPTESEQHDKHAHKGYS